MSKQPPPAPTASAKGPCPTIIQTVGRPGTGSLPRPIAPPDHPRMLLCNIMLLNSKQNTDGHGGQLELFTFRITSFSRQKNSQQLIHCERPVTVHSASDLKFTHITHYLQPRVMKDVYFT